VGNTAVQSDHFVPREEAMVRSTREADAAGHELDCDRTSCVMFALEAMENCSYAPRHHPRRQWS
jgi:hypothetical protein